MLGPRGAPGKDGWLVGHIIFTAVNLQPHQEISALILAPLAVSNGFQDAGVGGALIRGGLKQLAENGADAWMVQELKAGVIGRIKGKVQCSEVLNQPQHWRE